MAAGQDVELLNARENIEQEERKRHTELDNIMSIQQWMKTIDAANILDPNVALDVFKFGSVLGDPRKPVQPWLAKLLDKKASNNKDRQLGVAATPLQRG